MCVVGQAVSIYKKPESRRVKIGGSQVKAGGEIINPGAIVSEVL